MNYVPMTTFAPGHNLPLPEVLAVGLPPNLDGPLVPVTNTRVIAWVSCNPGKSLAAVSEGLHSAHTTVERHLKLVIAAGAIIVKLGQDPYCGRPTRTTKLYYPAK